MSGCTVYANDINPEAVKWMNMNFEKNRCENYHVFNLDGREFLQRIVFPQIEKFQNDLLKDAERQWCLADNKIAIVMNLPEIGWTFLDVFPIWLTKTSEEKRSWKLPVKIYCYTFAQEEDCHDDIHQRLKTIFPALHLNHLSIRFVRRVAPRKLMMCVEITLSFLSE